MGRAEFDEIFDLLLTQPLEGAGFKSTGKSLHLIRGVTHLALVRLGGRMSRPDTAAWVLCFRHSFLRIVQPESDPAALKFAVSDFPLKFTISELKEGRSEFRYSSRLLNYDYDRFSYENLEKTAIERDLKGLQMFLLRSIVPQAEAKSPEQLRDEILRYGSNGWCERMWVEDYDSYLGLTEGSER